MENIWRYKVSEGQYSFYFLLVFFTIIFFSFHKKGQQVLCYSSKKKNQMLNSIGLNLYLCLTEHLSVYFSGYQGAMCEQKIDPCASGPCHNNGSCLPQGTGLGFSCTCPAGFTGPTCAQLVDFCALNPCAHGICRSIGTSYRCLCVPGEDMSVCFVF